MHIVVFTGGLAPSPKETASFFSFAPDVDVVIAADSGLDTLESYRSFFDGNVDFSPDYILGDMDSLQNRDLLKKYSSVKPEILNTEKDFTDTELALKKACAIKPRDKISIVTLVGGYGGFVDHFLGVLDTFASDERPDIWLCGSQVVLYLPVDAELHARNVGLNDRISIARIPSAFTGGSVETEGLVWGSKLMRTEGMPSISNRIAKDYFNKLKPIKFVSRGCPFLVILPIQAKVSVTRP